MLRKIIEFIKSLFSLLPEHVREALSDEKGQGSFARYACAAILLNAIGWVWYVILITHGLPDFTGLTLFVSACLTTLYGTNQAKTVVAAWKGNSPQNQTQETKNGN